MKELIKKSSVIIGVILFVVAGVFLMNNVLNKKQTSQTNKIEDYVESNQIDGESKTKLQKLDELDAYGYVGAGYMNVNSEGVEKIYDEYKKYGMIRSDEDGSLSYKGQRVREFLKEDEGWRYFDDIGTIDLYFNADDNKLQVVSQEEFDARSLILAEYDNYCISKDMAEENPVEEVLKEE